MGSLLDDDPEPSGPLRFQLVVLRRMADHRPELVEEALRELGVPRSVMREANRRWQARLHARGNRPPRVADYAALLGAAESVTPARLGDLACEVRRWPLPLWDELRFEVTGRPGGQVLNAWLVRAPGAAGPQLDTTADLEPWGCTVDEVARAFAPATPLEGTGGHRFRLGFAAEGSRWVAEFGWGLLQRWEAAVTGGR